MSICDLHAWADLATVLTFLVGAFAYIRYQYIFHRKSKRLEDYLCAEKASGRDQGQRTALQITRQIGLTSDEIIQASFHNPRIGRRVKMDSSGLADELLFVYESEGKK